MAACMAEIAEICHLTIGPSTVLRRLSTEVLVSVHTITSWTVNDVFNVLTLP